MARLSLSRTSRRACASRTACSRSRPLAEIDDPDVREAHRQHALPIPITSFSGLRPTEEEFIAAFANFPDGFGQPWQVITLTPIDDFVGTLKATNRLMMVVIIILTMHRAVLHLFRIPPAITTGRKRFAAIAGNRKPAIRRADVAAIQHPGDRASWNPRLHCFEPR